MDKILYTHENESIAYLIDRLENQKDSEIFVSFDANPGLLQDMMNVKLLKREINALGKKITVVSRIPEVLNYAKQIGFEIAENIPEQKSPQEEVGGQVSFLGKENVETVIRDIKRPSFLAKRTEVSEGVSMPDELKEIRVDVTPTETAGGYSKIPLQSDSGEDEASSFFEKNGKSSQRKFEPSLFNKKTNEPKISEKIKHGLNISRIYSDKKVLAIVILAVVVFSGSVFYIFRPQATLDIIIKKEKIDFAVPIVADVAISKTDLENSKIPGQIIKLNREISGEFEATGASGGATKAHGKVAVYNEYGSDPQSLVANTRFQTPDGKIYRIEKKIIIPGAKMSGGKVVSAGVVEADVIADQPGTEYNISSSEFKIPGFEGTDKYNGFYAKSTESMSGGSMGETRAVSQADIDKAKNDLENRLKQSAKEYVASNVPGELTVLDSAIFGKVESFDVPKVGTTVDKFNASLKATYSIFAFDHKNLNAIAEKYLASQIVAGRKTFPETLVLEYEGGSLNLEQSTFGFIAKASEVTGGEINQDELKNMIAGKDEVEIGKILSANNAIENAEITFWPRWSSKAPKNAGKIKINIKE